MTNNKKIHNVGTKVYLHTYNNEKRERDRFIKKKNLGFEPATFRVIGEPSTDGAMGEGCFGAVRKLIIYC